MSAKRRKVEIVEDNDSSSSSCIPSFDDNIYQFNVTEAKHLSPKVFVQEAKHAQPEIVNIIADFCSPCNPYPRELLDYILFDDDELDVKRFQDRVHYVLNMHYTTVQAWFLVKKLPPTSVKGVFIQWLHKWFLYDRTFSEQEFYITDPNVTVKTYQSVINLLSNLNLFQKYMCCHFDVSMENVMQCFANGTLPQTYHLTPHTRFRSFAYEKKEWPEEPYKTYLCSSLKAFAHDIQQDQLQWFITCCKDDMLAELEEQAIPWKQLFLEAFDFKCDQTRTCTVKYDFQKLVDVGRHFIKRNSVRVPKILFTKMVELKLPCSGAYRLVIGRRKHVFKKSDFWDDCKWLEEERKRFRDLNQDTRYVASVLVPERLITPFKRCPFLLYEFLQMLPFH